MKVTDASAVVNSLYSQMTGQTDIATVDDSNIVDIGKKLNQIGSTEKIYNAICDRIGKMIVKNRLFRGKFIDLMKDGWEFGNILQTLRVKSIEATADPSYSPVNGQNYDQDTYKSRDVVQKFFTDYDNFQFDYWKPTDQLWTAFSSMDEMTRFLTGVEISITNSLNKRLQGLAKTAIGNFIAHIVNKEDTGSAYSTLKAVNLLKLYNDAHASATLTVANCRESESFLRFASKTMNNTYDRLNDMSVLFNLDGENDVFSNPEDIKVVLLSTFANDVKYHLYNAAGQFDYSLMQLPGYDTVPYWQASGDDYAEDTIGKIDITIKDEDAQGGTTTVQFGGIMGIMFDKRAVAINCERRKVTSHYNADLDQFHIYDKYLGQYINDFSENFVVFYIA